MNKRILIIIASVFLVLSIALSSMQLIGASSEFSYLLHLLVIAALAAGLVFRAKHTASLIGLTLAGALISSACPLELTFSSFGLFEPEFSGEAGQVVPNRRYTQAYREGLAILLIIHSAMWVAACLLLLKRNSTSEENERQEPAV